eukprot:gnl/Chilomastix_cuspidata/1183.p1 GENE.gnl/Chilomastix_cuspidata/1183~~gnl/Chilomastix_cuspidata/1183.p1  ORF type:complete len:1560 (-),score=306.00 gnl/Chilomastix_cuspidata/1183:32-4711(-)
MCAQPNPPAHTQNDISEVVPTKNQASTLLNKHLVSFCSPSFSNRHLHDHLNCSVLPAKKPPSLYCQPLNVQSSIKTSTVEIRPLLSTDHTPSLSNLSNTFEPSFYYFSTDLPEKGDIFNLFVREAAYVCTVPLLHTFPPDLMISFFSIFKENAGERSSVLERCPRDSKNALIQKILMALSRVYHTCLQRLQASFIKGVALAFRVASKDAPTCENGATATFLRFLRSRWDILPTQQANPLKKRSLADIHMLFKETCQDNPEFIPPNTHIFLCIINHWLMANADDSTSHDYSFPVLRFDDQAEPDHPGAQPPRVPASALGRSLCVDLSPDPTCATNSRLHRHGDRPLIPMLALPAKLRNFGFVIGGALGVLEEAKDPSHLLYSRHDIFLQGFTPFAVRHCVEHVIAVKIVPLNVAQIGPPPIFTPSGSRRWALCPPSSEPERYIPPVAMPPFLDITSLPIFQSGFYATPYANFTSLWEKFPKLFYHVATPCDPSRSPHASAEFEGDSELSLPDHHASCGAPRADAPRPRGSHTHSENQTIVCLVKWEKMSHLHASWVSLAELEQLERKDGVEEELNKLLAEKTRIADFQRRTHAAAGAQDLPKDEKDAYRADMSNIYKAKKSFIMNSCPEYILSEYTVPGPRGRTISAVRLILVKWLGLPFGASTWERVEDMNIVFDVLNDPPRLFVYDDYDSICQNLRRLFVKNVEDVFPPLVLKERLIRLRAQASSTAYPFPLVAGAAADSDFSKIEKFFADNLWRLSSLPSSIALAPKCPDIAWRPCFPLHWTPCTFSPILNGMRSLHARWKQREGCILIGESHLQLAATVTLFFAYLKEIRQLHKPILVITTKDEIFHVWEPLARIMSSTLRVMTEICSVDERIMHDFVTSLRRPDAAAPLADRLFTELVLVHTQSLSSNRFKHLKKIEWEAVLVNTDKVVSKTASKRLGQLKCLKSRFNVLFCRQGRVAYFKSSINPVYAFLRCPPGPNLAPPSCRGEPPSHLTVLMPRCENPTQSLSPKLFDVKITISDAQKKAYTQILKENIDLLCSDGSFETEERLFKLVDKLRYICNVMPRPPRSDARELGGGAPEQMPPGTLDTENLSPKAKFVALRILNSTKRAAFLVCSSYTECLFELKRFLSARAVACFLFDLGATDEEQLSSAAAFNASRGGLRVALVKTFSTIPGLCFEHVTDTILMDAGANVLSEYMFLLSLLEDPCRVNSITRLHGAFTVEENILNLAFVTKEKEIIFAKNLSARELTVLKKDNGAHVARACELYHILLKQNILELLKGVSSRLARTMYDSLNGTVPAFAHELDAFCHAPLATPSIYEDHIFVMCSHRRRFFWECVLNATPPPRSPNGFCLCVTAVARSRYLASEVPLGLSRLYLQKNFLEFLEKFVMRWATIDCYKRLLEDPTFRHLFAGPEHVFYIVFHFALLCFSAVNNSPGGDRADVRVIIGARSVHASKVVENFENMALLMQFGDDLDCGVFPTTTATRWGHKRTKGEDQELLRYARTHGFALDEELRQQLPTWSGKPGSLFKRMKKILKNLREEKHHVSSVTPFVAPP